MLKSEQAKKGEKAKKGEQVKLLEFDARQSSAQQEETLKELRQQGWSVRSVELGPDGKKRLQLVKIPRDPAAEH